MKACAPGKLLLSGAYAVLEGSPAIVCAVARHAYAFDASSGMKTTAEVSEALARPCSVDVTELQEQGQKLGLGSSAAALVAALALRASERGQDVGSLPTRRAIFERAREVHASVQNGGSGVDVAASTFGGTLHYVRGVARPVPLPEGLHDTAFFSGASARTSTLRERVSRFAEAKPALYVERMRALAGAAQTAASALEAGDAKLFVSAVAGHLAPLGALGTAADAPIVPPAFAELARAAQGDGAAFIPSGAGGGDVGVFVGMTAPSPSFKKRALALSMKHLPLAVDSVGVRVIP